MNTTYNTNCEYCGKFILPNMIPKHLQSHKELIANMQQLSKSIESSLKTLRK